MNRGRTRAERLAQESIRMRAVQRVIAGETVADVSRLLGSPRQAIYRWVSAYETGGADALHATKAIGANSKLTKQQTELLAKTISSKNPAELQFPFALWTREIVRELIKRQFGVTMSLTGVGKLLWRLGFTVQRPLIYAYERNPKAVEQWLKVEYPAIRAQAKKAREAIFFGDESGIRSDYHSGTTWAPREKPRP